ncbi:MAG TPA: FAD-binding oxidoreductase, partial [Oxalicibacterium sp.]|nr:FAD-binding oxidoreductase [Oxalicibacterium sp.]
MTDFVAACRRAIGARHVLTEEADTAPYLLDRRGRFTGAACAVVRPSSTEEVATIVRLCNEFSVPIVPQGGNTGLVLGGIPDRSGKAVVLSLQRMERIRAIDAVNNTMTVEAGCILQRVQQAAADAQRLFPLSLAAEGSCTIGGNLASNAGGTAVLRYGNARELCLGLEVVTPQGEIWDGLRGLRKDNTGYDLRDLYVGAEGTLGIITAAVLKLFPLPKAQTTALAALASPDDALRLLALARAHCAT